MYWTIPVRHEPPRSLRHALRRHASWADALAFARIPARMPPDRLAGPVRWPCDCDSRGQAVVRLRRQVVWLWGAGAGPALECHLGRCPRCLRAYWHANWGDPVWRDDQAELLDRDPWRGTPRDPRIVVAATPEADQQIRADLVAEAAAAGLLDGGAPCDGERLIEVRGLDAGIAAGACECPFCGSIRWGVPRAVPLPRREVELAGVPEPLFVGRCDGGCGRVYWG